MFQAIKAAGRKAWGIHSAWRKLGGCRVFFMTGAYNGRRSGAGSWRMELEGLRRFKKGLTESDWPPFWLPHVVC